MSKKYEEIILWVREQTGKGNLRYGDRLPPEKKLMEQFGVSRQTVRRALKTLGDEGVVESRRGSGTYVCEKKRVRSGREVRIAAMLTYADTYIFPSILKGMEGGITDAGCVLQISVTDNAVEKERMILREFIRNRSIDGLIAETVRSGLPNPNLDLYRELEKTGIPILFINSFYRELDCPHVSMDDSRAGYLAARHLLECGHTRIGGIFKADDGQGHLRYAGYTRALIERDIKVIGRSIIWMDSEEIHEMEGEGSRIMKRLEGCTACVCYNDEIAYRLVSLMRNAGKKVPDDLSIVGIDNSSLARFCTVPLTSVNNPVEELGKTAAGQIVRCVTGDEPMETMELEPELVVRDSVRVVCEFGG